MSARTTSDRQPIKVGLIADQTGPLSFVGLANANVARMVVGDINAKGGLLGREVKLYIEDSETTDAAAAAAAARLVEQDVDVVLGGIYSSARQAIKSVAVLQAGKLYIYPEQYEGEERDPLIFCTGPVPRSRSIRSFRGSCSRRAPRSSIYRPPTTSGRAR
jgi:branched-chain amino acid transport system substrate-binding protein